LITDPEVPPPPPPEERTTVPVWVPFFALFAVLVIVSIVGLAVYGVAKATDTSIKASDDLPVSFTQALTFFQDLVFVFAAWIGVKLALGKVTAADLGLRRVRRIWPAIGWAALALVAFNGFALLLAEIFGQPKEQALVDDIRAEDALAVVIAWGLLVCVLAPLVEEVFFRGFMFTVFARRMGVAWAALLDGIVFGLGHAGGAEAVQLVALGAFGVALCLLYWRTQSIIPGMALHALNNSIAFGETLNLDPGLRVGVVVGSVGVVVAAATAVSSRTAVAA
jgi:membrane protease YdiL (CAAX protease family)